jgi:hypothetical protein
MTPGRLSLLRYTSLAAAFASTFLGVALLTDDIQMGIDAGRSRLGLPPRYAPMTAAGTGG